MRLISSTIGKGNLGTITKIRYVLHGINIHPAYLIIPISLGIIAASFEGISVGLLIPLLDGLMQKDYSFIQDAPYIGRFVRQLPESILTSDRFLLVVLISVFTAVVFLKNIFKYLAALSMDFFAIRALHHLRKNIFVRYLSFGKLYFDKGNIGHHANMLMQITNQALAPVLNTNKYMGALFSLIVYMVIMSLISWKLTVFALLLFVVLHFAVHEIVKSIRRLSVKIVERGNALGKKSIEILSTIPLVKAYCTEDQEKELYAKISDEKAQFDFKARIFRELMLPMQEMITLVAAISLFLFMLWLLVGEEIGKTSSFIVYFYLVLNASSKFGSLTSLRGNLANADGSLDEVMRVFSDEEKYFVISGAKQYTALESEIEFRNTHFSYNNGYAVLKGLNLKIKKGAMTAIVGPTGGGKSTIINLLMRYYDCDPGSIFIDGVDIRAFSLQSFLSHVAIVNQETLLLHDTLYNNITYGLEGKTKEEVVDVIERSRLGALVKKLPDGMDTYIGDRGVQLSGGEKQRVAIARALLKGAEILILDEATSSLDSSTEKLIQEAIDEVVKGRTALVIAHRLSTIQHADNIVVIADGKVESQGTLEVLLEKDSLFTTMWNQQRFE